EGATVTAIRRGGGRAVLVSARTDDKGVFALTRLGPGAYDVFAVSRRWRSAPHGAVVGLARAGAPLVLEAFSASAVEGMITVEQRPCADGSVVLDGPTSSLARTGPDGVVRFEGVIPGAYTAVVHCAGAAELRDRFEVVAGEELPPRAWSLSRGLSVTGS